MGEDKCHAKEGGMSEDKSHLQEIEISVVDWGHVDVQYFSSCISRATVKQLQLWKQLVKYLLHYF